MAQPSVRTVQFVDPRIEPQSDPVYDYVIGPTQNQYYKIDASSKSNHSVFFNNLTTLGTDRAYLDTFEVETTVEIVFKTNQPWSTDNRAIIPAPSDWTFDSFPLNKCCDSIRVNINGGAFFSQPLSYVRAKERYMNQEALAKSYENVCPCQAPVAQTESCRDYSSTMTAQQSIDLLDPMGCAYPTRLARGRFNFMQSQSGMKGGYNNSIVRLGAELTGTSTQTGYENYYVKEGEDHNMETHVTVTWREPLFCSPFSSRYDATYGRPLYNITSLDINLIFQNLGNMIRLANFGNKLAANGSAATTVPLTDRESSYMTDTSFYVTVYNIDIKKCQLCYQVCTIPTTVTRPLSTLTPYRRFVPYITEISANPGLTGGMVSQRSGVYTLNEIPTAIWVFIAPELARYQTNDGDALDSGSDGSAATKHGNFDSNKLFGYITHISASMANTTQLLNEAQPIDLYRIAKANGCQDSYLAWGVYDAVASTPHPLQRNTSKTLTLAITSGPAGTLQEKYVRSAADSLSKTFYGPGSVLRLIPGVDLVVPDQPLIPGANANNMVFQIDVQGYVPPRPSSQTKYAVWLLFEYVGVASISPGQCEISMNPLGSGEIMSVSPIVSATSVATEGTLEGSGAVWEWIKRLFRIGMKTAKDNQLVSKGAKLLAERLQNPTAKELVEDIGKAAASKGYGIPHKRSNGGGVVGGAVMGLGDWT